MTGYRVRLRETRTVGKVERVREIVVSIQYDANELDQEVVERRVNRAADELADIFDLAKDS